MPPLPKKKHSSGRQGKLNSHRRATVHGVIKCPNCAAYTRSHRVCGKCGYYKNREVIPMGTTETE